MLFTTDQNRAVSGGWRFPWRGGGYGERGWSLSCKMGNATGTKRPCTRQRPVQSEAQPHPRSERAARPGPCRKPAQPISTQFSLETGHPHTVPASPPSLRPCSLPTTRPGVPWTDLLPFPAFCRSTNWKFGWPCLFIFLECSGFYFHGIFSAVQRFHFKLQDEEEEKPVPVSTQTHNRKKRPRFDSQSCLYKL